MPCLNCNKELPACKPASNGRGVRKRKYCSKQCSNEYYKKTKRYYKYEKKNPDWGSKTKNKIAKRKQQQERYLALLETHLLQEQIMEELDIEYGHFHGLKTKLGFKEFEKVNIVENGRSKNVFFYDPKVLDIIKEYLAKLKERAQIPDGYIPTKNIPNFGNIKKILGHAPDGVIHKLRMNVYPVTEVEKWRKKYQSIKEREKERRVRRAQERQKQIESEQKQEQLKASNETAMLAKNGWIFWKDIKIPADHRRKYANSSVYIEVANKIGIKLSTQKTSHYDRKKNIPSRSRYFKKREIDSFFEKTKQLALEKKNQKERRLFHRKDDWTSDDEYEKSLMTKISEGSLPEYALRTKKGREAVDNNKKIMKKYFDHGEVTYLECTKCKKTLPHPRFYADYRVSRGRTSQCKQCKIKAKQGNKKPVPKNKVQFQNQFIVSIKRDLSIRNGEFVKLEAIEIWNKLPYTKEEFSSYIESQFLPWMDWSNNGRPKKNKKTWQLDHIKPKIDFDFKSMDDPEFLECWSLKNLNPIEARLNLVKSGYKSLNERLRSIFIRGIKIDNHTEKFLESWNYYFPYSVQEAKIEIKNKLSQNMTMENHGTIWHLDHNIPCAALPFKSTECENYKQLWSLENLVPLKKRKNLSKGSKYQGKKHFVLEVENFGDLGI